MAGIQPGVSLACEFYQRSCDSGRFDLRGLSRVCISEYILLLAISGRFGLIRSCACASEVVQVYKMLGRYLMQIQYSTLVPMNVGANGPEGHLASTVLLGFP